MRPSSREHESSPLFWGSHTVLKSVLCHKERPSGDPPSTSAVHTLPLSHAPRRESGAPHRFPGHAHRAAPHPRARVVKPPVSSQAEFLRQPWAQAGSEPGVRALGVAQRPRAHASAPGGGPEAPPMQPFPNSRAWEKRFFLVFSKVKQAFGLNLPFGAGRFISCFWFGCPGREKNSYAIR